MSDVSQLTVLREQAARLRSMQQAAELLPELERQAAQQQAEQQAQQQAAHAQVEFDQALVQFQELKKVLDQELNLWVARGQEIIEHRLKLAARANSVQALASKLAESQLRAGIIKSPLGDVVGEAQQILINRTGYSKLMTFPNQDGPAGLMLSVIRRFTGDEFIKLPKPAIFAIDTSAGPVVETRF